MRRVLNICRVAIAEPYATVRRMIKYLDKKDFNIIFNNTTPLGYEVMKRFVANRECMPAALDMPGGYDAPHVQPITVDYTHLLKRQAVAKATLMHVISVAQLIDNAQLNMFQWMQNTRVDES